MGLGLGLFLLYHRRLVVCLFSVVGWWPGLRVCLPPRLCRVGQPGSNPGYKGFFSLVSLGPMVFNGGQWRLIHRSCSALFQHFDDFDITAQTDMSTILCTAPVVTAARERPQTCFDVPLHPRLRLLRTISFNSLFAQAMSPGEPGIRRCVPRPRDMGPLPGRASSPGSSTMNGIPAF